jgi:hypothetical protein
MQFGRLLNEIPALSELSFEDYHKQPWVPTVPAESSAIFETFVDFILKQVELLVNEGRRPTPNAYSRVLAFLLSCFLAFLPYRLNLSLLPRARHFEVICCSAVFGFAARDPLLMRQPSSWRMREESSNCSDPLVSSTAVQRQPFS